MSGAKATGTSDAGAARAPAGGGELEFTVRVSDRARHVRLVITEAEELVVVVPRRFDRRAISGIVEAKRTWIERAQARVRERRAACTAAAEAEPALPDLIRLPALDEEWLVEYRAPAAGRRGRGASARQVSASRLVVSCLRDDYEAGSRALIEWLRRRAREALEPRLEALSRSHGLSFTRVGVRHQRTRWGSCSPSGAISLNLRLLFLEPQLVDHILIHELCHTKELNHSKRFWALVRSHDPEWRVHRKQAREAWRSLPVWIHPRQAGPRL